MKKTILILSLMALFLASLASFVSAQCQTDTDCDDGVACTDDRCFVNNNGGTCFNVPNPDNCDLNNRLCHPVNGCICKPCMNSNDCQGDGIFCNGEENYCAGTCCEKANINNRVNCNDNNPCTFDACNEDIDSCINIPRDEICNDGLDNDCDKYVDLDDIDCHNLNLSEKVLQLETQSVSLSGRVSLLEQWKTTVDGTLAWLQQQIDNIVNGFCDMVYVCPEPMDPCQQACSDNGYSNSACRNNCAGPWSVSATEGDVYCSSKICCCK